MNNARVTAVDERLVKVCMACKRTYSQFYLRCQFCNSANFVIERAWVARAMGY